MTSRAQPTRWDLFRILCRVLGGQDTQTLKDCFTANLLPQLVDMAESHDMTPALAVRCNEQLAGKLPTISTENQLLTQALRDNTVRNMQISAQALKLTKQLNKADITPLFLKGTVQLLAARSENLGFRKQIDIDLLVEAEQLEAAANVFLEDKYSFYQFSGDSSKPPTKISDTRTAFKHSASHHHLPPLAKAGYATTVELHRHFLPKRFQHRNPLEPLFSTAIPQESHDAEYLFPSTEYQIIHLILGKLVHDGHLARRTMPLREACDYIHLMGNAKGKIDSRLVQKHSGKSFFLFATLVAKLMAYTPEVDSNEQRQINTEQYTRMMRKRYNSPTIGTMLNTYARTLHLSHSLAHSPAKLPAYFNRLIYNK